MVPFIVAGVALAAGVGGVVFGADQQHKRDRDRRRYRRDLERKEQELAAMEAVLAEQLMKLGKKDAQVRLLLTRIRELNAEIAEMKGWTA